jgi:polysaccharide deacetylase family protein (PEP-CTERM system associated)
MLNLLTIDLEDYFQVHAFSKVIRYEDWDNYECRIERNTDRLLAILSSVHSPQHLKPQHSSTAALNNSVTHSLSNSFTQKVQGTFFVLGWLAERYPDLIRRIHKEGHEIACHGYAHRLVYTQSRNEFRQDIKRAKSILEDITGNEVIGYRAPSYSVTKRSQWAFEVLVEEGFKYDSSIFPIRHDFYGMPNAPRFPFVVSLNGNNNVEFSMLSFNNSLTHSPNNSVSGQQHGTTAPLFQRFTPNSELRTPNCLLEFPLSTIKLFGQNVPISGGGYFRLFPYSLIRKGLKGINEKEGKPFIFYMHPWELDSEQPRIKEVSLKSRFRHYVKLDKAEGKFKRLLGDFQFSTIRQFLIQNS